MSLPFERASKTSRAFEAKFPGICEECQEGFERGEEVMYAGDDLVHANTDECVTFQERPAKKPCGKCRLMHAGDCF